MHQGLREYVYGCCKADAFTARIRVERVEVGKTRTFCVVQRSFSWKKLTDSSPDCPEN
jgi:hypothetical protein